MNLPESGAITIRINRIGEVIPAYSITGIPVAEAIEIPPHGRLIDADALKRKVYEMDWGTKYYPDKFMDEVVHTPTIIEAEE